MPFIGFIVTCQWLAGEGDTLPSLTTGTGGAGPPSTIYTRFARGTSSLAAAALFLSFGALSAFTHTILGAFLTLCGAAGAAACR